MMMKLEPPPWCTYDLGFEKNRILRVGIEVTSTFSLSIPGMCTNWLTGLSALYT